MESEKYNPESSKKIDPEEVKLEINRIYENSENLNNEKLKKLLASIEGIAEYVEYKKQPVQYETFDRVVESIEKQLEDVPEESRTKTIEQIKQMAEQVKFSIHNYYNSVRRHLHIERQRMRMDHDTFIDRIRSADVARTAAHNGLISSLTIFSRTCFVKLAKEYNLILDRSNWFEGHEFEDRHVIGSWALQTEFGHRVESVKLKAEAQLKKETT
jgi:hypothetical protein